MCLGMITPKSSWSRRATSNAVFHLTFRIKKSYLNKLLTARVIALWSEKWLESGWNWFEKRNEKRLKMDMCYLLAKLPWLSGYRWLVTLICMILPQSYDETQSSAKIGRWHYLVAETWRHIWTEFKIISWMHLCISLFI